MRRAKVIKKTKTGYLIKLLSWREGGFYSERAHNFVFQFTYKTKDTFEIGTTGTVEEVSVTYDSYERKKVFRSDKKIWFRCPQCHSHVKISKFIPHVNNLHP